jgi:hypothetical protein
MSMQESVLSCHSHELRSLTLLFTAIETSTLQISRDIVISNLINLKMTSILDLVLFNLVVKLENCINAGCDNAFDAVAVRGG